MTSEKLMADSNHIDELYMQRCLDLAIQGKGHVSPNPMVGSVIVYKNKIIGEGYHRNFGEAHAEVNAVKSVKDQSLLQESTLYVNLEPCAHHGKTPPCSDLIIEKKIPRVVIGSVDPFAKVAGKGIEKMKQSGISVTTNVLLDKCEQLNKRFFTAHRFKRPYVILKWAQTRDGFIDKERIAGDPLRPNWITNEISRTLVHKWRTEEQAIMVGRNTALKDNPRLNIREWVGNSPVRILLDKHLLVTAEAYLLDASVQTLIFNSVKTAEKGNTRWVKLDYNHPVLSQILTFLYKEDIISLFVEGGKTLLQSFINEGLWDEARVFIGDTFFQAGVKAPVINGGIVKETSFDKDTLFLYQNTLKV